jgi:hypothetical protein
MNYIKYFKICISIHFLMCYDFCIKWYLNKWDDSRQ